MWVVPMYLFYWAHYITSFYSNSKRNSNHGLMTRKYARFAYCIFIHINSVRWTISSLIIILKLYSCHIYIFLILFWDKFWNFCFGNTSINGYINYVSILIYLISISFILNLFRIRKIILCIYMFSSFTRIWIFYQNNYIIKNNYHNKSMLANFKSN